MQASQDQMVSSSLVVGSSLVAHRDSEPSTMDLIVNSLHRQNTNMEVMQTMALQLGTLITTIAHKQDKMVESQKTLEEQQDDICKRLMALEKNSTTQVVSIDSSATLRYAMRYLMTAGMDTRTGLICAFPVMYGHECFIAISLHLLKFSFNRVFQSHSTKDRSISNFHNAFSQIEATATRERLDRAIKVLPLQANAARKCDMFACMKASRFVELCLDIQSRYPIEDSTLWTTDHLWTGKVLHELAMPARMKHDSSSADDYSMRNKIAWNVPLWKDIIESKAVCEYVRIIAEICKTDAPSSGCHFRGIELFPDLEVDEHPRKSVRPGKQHLPIQGKQPYQEVVHRHLYESSEDSSEDADEDKEPANENAPPPVVADENAPPPVVADENAPPPVAADEKAPPPVVADENAASSAVDEKAPPTSAPCDSADDLSVLLNTTFSPQKASHPNTNDELTDLLATLSPTKSTPKSSPAKSEVSEGVATPSGKGKGKRGAKSGRGRRSVRARKY